ncbi:hypothetical protein [Spongiactinospora sp. TRM90649]|uniref:tetratricopeptide repeat protein n=1 Tax=Spongiactinospora sp. TRM90649 TaxID=3031114 RepID=UPI0023F8DA93|nr:hypothetical protein [Spongiactinospora sp. TRM90649]MDF5752662.1 hypothetical protein [Spongiactinospora sp. TRM90649]
MNIRSRTLLRRAAPPAAAIAVAGALTAFATLVPFSSPTSSPGASPPTAPPAGIAYERAAGSAADLDRTVTALQTRLTRLPKDHQAWATLGTAYVEQARLTADPAYYPKAEQALATSLRLSPGNAAGLTGQAALAAGRHEFAQAVRLARSATSANPYGPAGYGVLADAYTQLGRLADADRAIDRMMRLRPGVASFSRASYAAELRGDLGRAEELLRSALADAFYPADVAYCRHRLGELALRAGDLRTADEEYDRALAAYPTYLPAVVGKARAAALAGRLDTAAELYRTAVDRLPLPQHVIEYAEVRVASGQDPAEQWRLLRAVRDLSSAAGVRDDVMWAEYEADHGDPALAVRHARTEYARNPNLAAADALAWALFRAGRPREALPFAREALATGRRDALAAHHRAEIEKALGMDAEARRSRALVREFNPAFDPALPALGRPS